MGDGCALCDCDWEGSSQSGGVVEGRKEVGVNRGGFW